jgi:plastocyanin
MRYTKLLMVLMAVSFAACSDDEPAAPQDEADVVARGQTFSPANLVLTPADSIAGSEGVPPPMPVVWRFEGGPHNVTFEDGSPGSGNMSDGTFERDFQAVTGTYRYRCTIHSSDFLTGMVGRVVVQ